MFFIWKLIQWEGPGLLVFGCSTNLPFSDICILYTVFLHSKEDKVNERMVLQK